MPLLPDLTPTACFEYTNEDLHVEYGHIDALGFYISVYDLRLKLRNEQDPDFFHLSTEISWNGSGCYLTARTGEYGIGTRVSVPTMRRLWEIYGAEEQHLRFMDRFVVVRRTLDAVLGHRVQIHTLQLDGLAQVETVEILHIESSQGDNVE
ncbi:hypothetical protein BDV25DRAFT_140839 [Aspergillus avenaceus]|uniref:Uncharacterized protein n=1 Tax=Aspergillus avenaceus TaxID=36643 RepID=A0A5N6TTJ5_ASPAV|nr:hypothetical protein BDV25DRAFT_140839 [Aspergillus avenaceus]